MAEIIWKNKSSKEIEGLIITETPPITKPKMKVNKIEIDWVNGNVEIEQTSSNTLQVIEEKSAEAEKERMRYYLDGNVLKVKYCESGLRGDINQNGKIDARDYLLLKRAYFGTYDLNDVTTLLADVNENGTVDARDYLLLKRAYFGTYTIANPYVYEK